MGSECINNIKITGPQASISTFKSVHLSDGIGAYFREFPSESEDNDITYRFQFDSGWKPPLLLFKEFSLEFPDLTFSIDFWGVGDGYCGDAIYKNGETLLDDYFENDEYDACFSEMNEALAIRNVSIADSEKLDIDDSDDEIPFFDESNDNDSAGRLPCLDKSHDY